MHIVVVLLHATNAFKLPPARSGPQCEPLDLAAGETDTASLRTSETVLAVAETIGSAHSVTLASECEHHMGVDPTEPLKERTR